MKSLSSSRWRKCYNIGNTRLTVKRMHRWRLMLRWRCWYTLQVGPWYFELFKTPWAVEEALRRDCKPPETGSRDDGVPPACDEKDVRIAELENYIYEIRDRFVDVLLCQECSCPEEMSKGRCPAVTSGHWLNTKCPVTYKSNDVRPCEAPKGTTA